MTQQYEEIIPRIKLITIGDNMVGKSCIIKRFCESKFYDRYKATIGIDYGVKQFEYKNKKIKIDFWDMSGNKYFKEIRKEFYQNTQICFIVFDCSDIQSFNNLQKWINETKEFNMPNNTQIYVISNKIDNRHKLISNDQVQEWLKSNNEFNNFKYFQTSSKSGYGIQELFQSVFKLFLS